MQWENCETSWESNTSVVYVQLDLADMESVRKFVDDFHATEKKLHVLINNAGLALNFKDTKRQYTKDNLELTMGTNHFGKEAFQSVPFRLTKFSLSVLRTSLMQIPTHYLLRNSNLGAIAKSQFMYARLVLGVSAHGNRPWMCCNCCPENSIVELVTYLLTCVIIVLNMYRSISTDQFAVGGLEKSRRRGKWRC